MSPTANERIAGTHGMRDFWHILFHSDVSRMPCVPGVKPLCRLTSSDNHFHTKRFTWSILFYLSWLCLVRHPSIHPSYFSLSPRIHNACDLNLIPKSRTNNLGWRVSSMDFLASTEASAFSFLNQRKDLRRSSLPPAWARKPVIDNEWIEAVAEFSAPRLR